MNNIKVLRKEAGVTQAQLGQAIGVGQSTVAMWETGESMPRAEKLPELAKFLGCSMDELFCTQKEPLGGVLRKEEGAFH